MIKSQMPDGRQPGSVTGEALAVSGLFQHRNDPFRRCQAFWSRLNFSDNSRNGLKNSFI